MTDSDGVADNAVSHLSPRGLRIGILSERKQVDRRPYLLTEESHLINRLVRAHSAKLRWAVCRDHDEWQARVGGLYYCRSQVGDSGSARAHHSNGLTRHLGDAHRQEGGTAFVDPDVQPNGAYPFSRGQSQRQWC